MHREYEPAMDDFISSPTIAPTHMPHSLLRRQVKMGWQEAHYPRVMTVHTGRDSIKLSQWNDL